MDIRDEKWRKVAELNGLLSDIERSVQYLDTMVERSEKPLVINIETNISTVRYLVAAYRLDPGFIAEHLHGGLKGIKDELDEISNQISKVATRKINQLLSEWLGIIVKKTNKIKLLTSNFGELPPDKKIVAIGAEASTSTRGKVKMLSNTRQCIDLCVEESLLVSPMIASLKKSYDRLPLELKLCLLCLSVFPENFVIKKRPLVYWWMAEGFLTDEDDDGEGNFMELIRKEFIQPCYHEGGNMAGKVGACRVQPWIRRMLVSIALEAQFFEFYGGREKKDGIWARLCLCNNEEDLNHAITSKTEMVLDDESTFQRLEMVAERLKWAKAKSIYYANKLDRAIDMGASNISGDPEVNGEQQTNYVTSDALDDLCHGCIYILDILIVMVHDDRKVITLGHLRSRCQWIIDNRKRYYDEFGVWSDNLLPQQRSLSKEISDLQEEMQGTYATIKHQLEALRSCLNDCMRHDDELYNRRKNCEWLQKHDDMFSPYHDLTLHFPSPMKKRDDGEYYYEGGKVFGNH
ncbi:PREDICTED: uncharacterized protein LOC109155861 [Ipomoea nil]|uniref:uncharacterized protein LOC109155861 n=1 Tax=Ipomoea nil TaxID=35883 RepID=UPI0009008598|nr:PREDICTED: uncharacterized protein LOC109155861 [Ipomoea nil]